MNRKLSPEPESWGALAFTISSDVAHGLGATDAPSDPITMLVQGLAAGILGSKPENFFAVSENTAPRTPYGVTLSFLADKFRCDLAAQADKFFD